MEALGGYGSSSSEEDEDEGQGSAAARDLPNKAAEVQEEPHVPYVSKVWSAKLPEPPKRWANGAIDPFKLAGTKLLSASSVDAGEETESRHKRARTEDEKPSGLLGMLPRAAGRSGSAGKARNGDSDRKSAAEMQARYEAQYGGGSNTSAARSVTVARSPHGDVVPASSSADATASASVPAAAPAIGAVSSEPSGRSVLPQPIFSMPSINVAPDVEASAAPANPRYQPQQHQYQPQQQYQQHPKSQPQHELDESLFKGMSSHERAQLTANMGNIRDVNPATMRQGAEEWQEPGGSGFVSQFAAYAGSKPGGRSKSKHQITSLVYDLAQKEGDILERQGKNFQTKKQTWGKYGWA